MKILFSDSDSIDTVDVAALYEVLDVLGHPEALVTDQSQVRDFQSFCFGMSEEDKREQQVLEEYHIAKLTSLTGRTVTINCYIWEVARDVALHKMEH